MGKKRKLNKFITKWIKSDLPEDRSSVLLLGVTRIPTSPVPARRPCSLPLGPCPNSTPSNLLGNCNNNAQARRNSFQSRRNIVRRNSSKKSRRNDVTANDRNVILSSSDGESITETNNCERQLSNCVSSEGCTSSGDISVETTPVNSISYDNKTAGTVMDRSVDSIGTCSLDVDASVEVSDHSEASSGGTLRSVNLSTPTPEPHLPSYLSLACTVNGYSTTINYDPDRLARSRDTSPHRPFSHDQLLNQSIATYSVHNNLLSPPNLVPLPSTKLQTPNTQPHNKNMTDQTITTHRQEFYSSTESYIKKESKSFALSMFSTFDTVDATIGNGIQNGIQTKCVNYDKTVKSMMTNGQSKCIRESHKLTNGEETKSFIQQRVERLYGPGALAQGFFVMKRQLNHSFNQNSDKKSLTADQDKHSKSLCDTIILDDSNSESGIKQSASSPSLPVLRHLRPEFRAQLPIMSPKKSADNSMQKSSTVPVLKDQVKVNGCSHVTEMNSKPVNGDASLKKINEITPLEESGEKNGHHFLKILQKETDRLLKLADEAEAELEDEELSEEVKGKLRSASGKARLLVSQKMQQFKGLCTNNINQVTGDQFPTTNEDLQGFWDMVMLQVDQVDTLFKEINCLKANNWQELKPQDSHVAKISTNGVSGKSKIKPRPRPTSAVNEEVRKQRELQRKQMLEDRRKAMRGQKKAQENVEIFVPESS